MSNNNTIPSPEEWLENNPHFQDEHHVLQMRAYADHVAALVHRNTQNEVVKINRQHFFAVEGLHTAPELNQAIMNIPLRAVYPAGEENREG